MILSYIWRADANWIRIPKTPDFDPFLNDYCPNRSGAQYAGHQKSSLRNEEIVALDSWRISIDIWPKSSYTKPICLHDFWRSIRYLISMFRWNMYENVTFPNLNRFPNFHVNLSNKNAKHYVLEKYNDLVLRHPLQFEGGFSLCSELSPFKKLHQKRSEKNGWDWKIILSFVFFFLRRPKDLSHYCKKSLPQAKFMCHFFGGITISGLSGSDIGEVNHLPKRAIRCTGVKKRWEKSSAINRHMTHGNICKIYIYISPTRILIIMFSSEWFSSKSHRFFWCR